LQRIFEGIPALANLLNFSTPKIGGLDPTFGVSFGLPQYGGAYGGYPTNFLGTGTAINPYYGGGGPGVGPNGIPNRISLGAVDINPLVSFQATANDKGELVKKPLINLHVTPNGCGLFGCEEEGLGGYDHPPHPPVNGPYYPPGPGKSGFLAEQGEKIKNFLSPKKHHPPPSYGPPPPVYNEGYNAPPPVYNEGYNAPPPVYQDSYKVPVKNSYNPAPHRPVKFDQSHPTVVKHEHHHYYHGSGGNNGNGNGNGGIQFGFDGNNNNFNNGFGNSNNFNNGFGNNPQFLGRTNSNDTDIEASPEEANNVKRNTNYVSFGVPEATEEPEMPKKDSGFKFPAGRSLKQSERRRRSPEEEKIEAVNLSNFGWRLKEADRTVFRNALNRFKGVFA
jgi:hypothetical protein